MPKLVGHNYSQIFTIIKNKGLEVKIVNKYSTV